MGQLKIPPYVFAPPMLPLPSPLALLPLWSQQQPQIILLKDGTDTSQGGENAARQREREKVQAKGLVSPEGPPPSAASRCEWPPAIPPPGGRFSSAVSASPWIRGLAHLPSQRE